MNSVTFLGQDTHVLARPKNVEMGPTMSCKENSKAKHVFDACKAVDIKKLTGAFSPDPSAPRLCIES